MRLIVSILVLALGACSSERETESRAASTPPAAAVGAPAAARASPPQAALMAIPDDPEALKRLEAMGYTIHAEQGHLHAPGVNSCPAMTESAVM